MVDQLLLRDQAPGARQQDFQQAEFARREIEHLLVDVGAAPDLVVDQRAVADDGRAAAGAAPGQGAHPRFQFRQGERLGHVVVGAQVEALDALLDRVGGGEDQHRQQGRAGAQAAQHFQAGHARQAEVEDEEVELLGGEGGVGVGAVAHAIDRVAGLAQGARQPVREYAIIFCK